MSGQVRLPEGGVGIKPWQRARVAVFAARLYFGAVLLPDWREPSSDLGRQHTPRDYPGLKGDECRLDHRRLSGSGAPPAYACHP
jgi:hypothetical protein